MAAPVYTPVNNVGGHPFLHTFIVCRSFSHSEWCEVVPHCHFDLHFSNSDVETSFTLESVTSGRAF